MSSAVIGCGFRFLSEAVAVTVNNAARTNAHPDRHADFIARSPEDLLTDRNRFCAPARS
jgi:hypothetical protein